MPIVSRSPSGEHPELLVSVCSIPRCDLVAIAGGDIHVTCNQKAGSSGSKVCHSAHEFKPSSSSMAPVRGTDTCGWVIACLLPVTKVGTHKDRTAISTGGGKWSHVVVSPREQEAAQLP